MHAYICKIAITFPGLTQYNHMDISSASAGGGGEGVYFGQNSRGTKGKQFQGGLKRFKVSGGPFSKKNFLIFFFAGSGCEKTCMCGTAMMHVLKLKLKIIQLGLKGQNRRQAIF